MARRRSCTFRFRGCFLLFSFTTLLAKVAFGEVCSYENYAAVLEYAEDLTDPSQPLLGQRSRLPFKGCFEEGRETAALWDVRHAIREQEEIPQRQKLPIVLVPGYLGTDEGDFGFVQIDYWFGIVDALADVGFTRVYPANIDPVGYSTNGPIAGSHMLSNRIGDVPADYNGRSCQLKVIVEAVLEATGAEQVNLIAHSQGALTARWMISNLGMEEQVNALITLSGAHKGVPLATFGFGPRAVPSWMLRPVERAVTKFLGRVCHGSDSTLAHGSHVEMWPPYTNRFFNPNCVDSDEVQYFSIAARMQDMGGSRISPYVLSEFWFIHMLYGWMNAGPSDGLVTVESAKGPPNDDRWTYLGDLVGKKVIPGTGIESRWFGIRWGVDHGAFMNFPFGLTKHFHFNAERFYVDLARMLNAYSN